MARIEITNRNYDTGTNSFTVQSVSDLESLPKYGIKGKDNLETVLSTKFGSDAFVIDTGDVYILNANNEWQVI